MKRSVMKLSLMLCLVGCGQAAAPAPAPAPAPSEPVAVDPGTDPDDDGDEGGVPTKDEEFASVISPLLVKGCAGAQCHTSGSSRDNLMKSADQLIKSTSDKRLGNGSMPVLGSPQSRVFSSADKATVLAFIKKFKG